MLYEMKFFDRYPQVLKVSVVVNRGKLTMKRLIIHVMCVAFALSAGAQSYTNVRPINGVGNEFKITAFALDKDNNKYIGTNTGLIKVSASGTVETLFSGNPVHAVVWHRSEGVWIAIDGNKIYNPVTRRQIALEGEDVQISSMALSGSSIWAGTNEGAYVVSTKNEEVLDHFTTENSKLESDVINDIFIDASRIKWLATDAGVVRVVDKKWKAYEKKHNMAAITGNAEGTWIAADNELWLVDPYNRWTPTGASDSLSQGEIRALAADKKGRIYILSDILVQFDPYSDEHVELNSEYSLQGGADVAIMFDQEDNLWVGSLEHGLVAMEVVQQEGETLSAYLTMRHPECSGETSGSLLIKVTGGTPPYRFRWNDPVLTGKDQEALSSGYYSVTIEDNEGMQEVLEATLDDPQPLTAQITSDGEEEVMVVARGGTGGYEYAWSHGAEQRVLSDLEPGQYDVVVTDNSGCTVVATYTKAAEITEPVLTDASDLEAVDAAVLKTIDAATLEVGQTLRIEQLVLQG